MSILIKGIDLPKDFWYLDLVITADGVVRYYGDEDFQIAEAVELPDHGDLIDRDKFVAEKREELCADCHKRKSLKTGRFVYEIGDCVCRACDTDDMLDYIEEAPVVIPAERS